MFWIQAQLVCVLERQVEATLIIWLVVLIAIDWIIPWWQQPVDLEVGSIAWRRTLIGSVECMWLNRPGGGGAKEELFTDSRRVLDGSVPSAANSIRRDVEVTTWDFEQDGFQHLW